MGDFPGSGTTSETLSLSARNVKLGLPLGTLALEASAAPDFSDQAFVGYGTRNDERLDVLLWPQGVACDLSSRGAYPDQLGGQALGYGANSGLVMVAGSDQSDSSSVVGALTFDTRTGESEIVDPRVRSVLSVARAFATISDFGKKLLVAGGENSLFENAPLNDSGEVYDPVSHAFEPNLLNLAVPRARHAAVTLSSGEVALLGGRGPDSAASSFVEIVGPSTRGSKLVDNLWLPRSAPVAFRLTDERLFVGGGVDRDGHPVAGLEWRAPDATHRLAAPFDGSTELPPRFDRAFVALPGGAVLAVGGCEDREPGPDEDCAAWCAHGCPPTPQLESGQAYDAYLIAAEGGVSALDFPIAAAQPVLLPGSDGRPWLVANDSDGQGRAIGDQRRLYRFNPWQQHFDRVPIDLDLNNPQSVPRFVALESDAFVWLDQRAAGPVLHGVRLGTRSVFSNDVVDLIEARDADDTTRPAHLVPDHPLGSSPRYDSVNAILSFEPSAPDTAVTCVWLADAEFADFSAKIAFTSAVLPSLRVGSFWLADEASTIHDGACPLPGPADANGGLITFRRQGTRLTSSLGDARMECAVSDERLPIAICASNLGAVHITHFSVTRSG